MTSEPNPGYSGCEATELTTKSLWRHHMLPVNLFTCEIAQTSVFGDFPSLLNHSDEQIFTACHETHEVKY